MSENKWLKNSLVYLIIIVAVIALWFTVVQSPGGNKTADISTVIAAVRVNQVAKITTTNGSSNAEVEYKDGTKKNVRLPDNSSIYEIFKDNGIQPENYPAIAARGASQWGSWLGTLGFLLPTLFLVGIFVFMMRQAQGTQQPGDVLRQEPRAHVHRQQADRHLRRCGRRGGGEAGAGRSRGVPEVPGEVRRARRAHPARRAAGRPSGHRQDAALARGGRRGGRALLLASPAPSSSRCSSASAPAACATCSTRPSATRPASSSSTRSTRSAASAAPGLGGSHDEREQTLNQILVEMDGFDSQHQRHRHRRHQPPRRARPGAAAPGPLRPPGGPRPTRTSGAAGDPRGAHARQAARRRRVTLETLAQADARLLGRRPGEPGQRGGDPGRAAQPEDDRHATSSRRRSTA